MLIRTIGFFVPHRKHIMSPLRAQHFNAIGLWRWYINITVTVLDIIHRRLLLKTQLYKVVRTLQETHDVSATKPNRLMLFRETATVCCENHTEHTHYVGRMQSFSMLKPVVSLDFKGPNGGRPHHHTFMIHSLAMSESGDVENHHVIHALVVGVAGRDSNLWTLVFLYTPTSIVGLLRWTHIHPICSCGYKPNLSFTSRVTTQRGYGTRWHYMCLETNSVCWQAITKCRPVVIHAFQLPHSLAQ
jgi:hypothetical protein